MHSGDSPNGYTQILNTSYAILNGYAWIENKMYTISIIRNMFICWRADFHVKTGKFHFKILGLIFREKLLTKNLVLLKKKIGVIILQEGFHGVTILQAIYIEYLRKPKLK